MRLGTIFSGNKHLRVLGLTGGIGMGKSTVTLQLASMGAHVCNADIIVHQLLAKGGAGVDPVGKAFKGVVKNGAVDRKALGAIVFKDKNKLKELEAILHPLVVAEENRFIEEQIAKGSKLVILDIPLLFETGAEKRCDAVMVVSSPAFIQRQRVMKRPGMTEEKFQSILASQMPDSEKRKRADIVIETGLGKAYSYRKIKQALLELA